MNSRGGSKLIRWGSPEGGSKSRASWEVGQLGADAGEEKARQAVAVDGRNARRRNPPDQTEPDHIQVSSKPISLEASTSTINPSYHLNIIC